MSEKIYFYILLILCVIWSQGIIGTFADEDIKESSSVLLREKRVVNRVAGQDVIMSIQGVPYVVVIKENMRIKCVGSILSLHIVITIKQCVWSERAQNRAQYQVSCGSARSDRGYSHQVVNIERYSSGHPTRHADGIALLTVHPPFVFGATVSYIPLHSGPLIQGTLGIVLGWGFNFRCADRGTSIPTNLRAIQVPIIAHQDCVNIYRAHNIEITASDVCTHHPLQHCGHNDGGAPLVVEGQLAGIHLFTGRNGDQNDPEYPEVFALLQDFAYSQWITRTMSEINARLQVHHK